MALTSGPALASRGVVRVVDVVRLLATLSALERTIRQHLWARVRRYWVNFSTLGQQC